MIAKATVLAEGTLGHLTDAAVDYFDLHGDDPQRWELGVKEVWEVAEAARPGHPHDGLAAAQERASGTSSAAASSTRWARTRSRIGFVAGLDYTDATFSCHDALQELKTHPFVKKILEGGKRVAWGAKTIPSGGYWAMPSGSPCPAW